MGHIGVKGLKHATKGLTWDDSHSETRCRVCALANIKRLPFPKFTKTHQEKPLSPQRCMKCLESVFIGLGMLKSGCSDSYA